MLINSDDAGFTLIEILLVISLFSLFAVIVIPGHSVLMIAKKNPGEQLSHWLAQREFESVLSIYPNKICISINKISSFEYKDKEWHLQRFQFIVPEGAIMKASCKNDEQTEEDCCFMVGEGGLYPQGEIQLQDKNGRQYMSKWMSMSR